MNYIEMIGLIASGISIIGVIVGGTRYITLLQFKLREEQLKSEKNKIQNTLLETELKYKELVDGVAMSAKVGATALYKKQEIEDELMDVVKHIGAEAASIYIPFRKNKEVTGLVFLVIYPLGHGSPLKKKVIPLKSLAGRCFTKRQSFVLSNSKNDPNHFDKADRVSGYKTQDSLNYALCFDQQCVGVLQLLNKADPMPFNEQDLERIQPHAERLAEKLAEFVAIPSHLELIGVTQNRNPEYAVIMFCDLTCSSLLFNELNVTAAIQHINEYIEILCDIAFRHKATIDSYTGDGVMFRFNIPRHIHDPVNEAAKAALEMQLAFEKLKEDWITMGDAIGSIYNRIGMTYGPVTSGMIGHPQNQHLSIFGESVHLAAYLCEAATRDRNVIIMDKRMADGLGNKAKFSMIAKGNLGKANGFIEQAYELNELV